MSALNFKVVFLGFDPVKTANVALKGSKNKNGFIRKLPFRNRPDHKLCSNSCYFSGLVWSGNSTIHAPTIQHQFQLMIPLPTSFLDNRKESQSVQNSPFKTCCGGGIPFARFFFCLQNDSVSQILGDGEFVRSFGTVFELPSAYSSQKELIDTGTKS